MVRPRKGLRVAEAGDCFTAALERALELHEDGADVRIVHALPVGTGGEVEGLHYWHAFCVVTERHESGVEFEVVHDFSNGNEAILPASLYFKIGRITESWSYSMAEWLAAASEHGTYGPWVEGWESMGLIA